MTRQGRGLHFVRAAIGEGAHLRSSMSDLGTVELA
jgi:hypothetical protein